MTSLCLLLLLLLAALVMTVKSEFDGVNFQTNCAQDLLFQTQRHRKKFRYSEKEEGTADDVQRCAAVAYRNWGEFALFNADTKSCNWYKSEEFTPVCDNSQLNSWSDISDGKILISCITCHETE